MPINNNILNQKGTPAFYSDIFANRPAFGYAGRVFISTDTGAIYEDTGTAWTLIADAGAGTTGTLQQVTTNGNTTTLGISVQGLTIGKGAGTIASNTAIGFTALNGNTTGSSNTGIGYQSLSLNTTGTGNTAIGQQSLYNNTTASFNTAIGNSSLSANVSGQYNTSIGESSLSTQGTANNNTAIGSAALTANTTGTPNTAVGRLSLAANTTGGSNTAVGSNSLQANTTASNNTAIGYSSLNLNTTGDQNTAIGGVSLTTNTTGFSNTAIGYSSLFFNTTGGGNIAIGSASLLNNTTGNDNIAIGFFAGGGTTGNSNTIIGKSAGAFMTTGSSNILIGNLSGYNITTGSNNTILGSYQGTTTLASNIVLSDGAGNVRLFSNSAGLIGINQAVGTPSAQLDIHTTATYGLGVNGTGTSNAYLGFANAGTFKWRIGNTYNAGANSLDIFNLGTSATALSFSSTTNNATFTNEGYFAGATASSGLFGASRLIVNNEIGCQFSNTTGTYFRLSCGGVNQNVTFIADVFTGSATNLDFNVNAGQKMRIVGSTGNVLIGSSTTDDTTNKLQVNGNAKVSGQFSVSLNSLSSIASFSNTGYGVNIGAGSGGQWNLYVTDNAGTPNFYVQANGSGYLLGSAWTYGSDFRMKENIFDLDNGIEMVLKMKPKHFDYIKGTKNNIGFIAQDIQEIIPQAVSITEKTGMLGLKTDFLLPYLVKAIQELNEKLVRNNIN